MARFRGDHGAIIVSRQLVQEYHFVEANGPESVARWRKSLTPYQRESLERALAFEAEELAHPLPSDPEPTPLPFGGIFIQLQVNVANLAAALAGIPASLIAATATQSTMNAQLTWAGRELQREAMIKGELEGLAASTGLPLEGLRERFREYAATWPAPPSDTIWDFCTMVREEVFGRPSVGILNAGSFYIEPLTFDLPRTDPYRTFKTGLRRPWWQR